MLAQAGGSAWRGWFGQQGSRDEAQAEPNGRAKCFLKGVLIIGVPFQGKTLSKLQHNNEQNQSDRDKGGSTWDGQAPQKGEYGEGQRPVPRCWHKIDMTPPDRSKGQT